jgi:pimeloyl-ACP methyl ester carboxylesterase
MAEQLNAAGVEVSVGDVVLRTPGLVGIAEVHYPEGTGMRAAEQATPQLLDALDRTGVDEQLTVEIREPAETDEHGGTRAAGGGNDIEIEVPGPGTGLAQMLLYVAEDLTASWHLPADLPADSQISSRGADRRTYRVPRTVAYATPSDADRQRGILGAVGSKLLKVLVFPLVDPLLGKVGDFFASRWEQRNRRNLLRSFDPATYRQASGAPLADWPTLAAGPALLFVHGTMSQAHTGFQRFPPGLLQQLHDRYDGRVFAFDHYTISVDPTENVRWFASQLPDAAGLTVDIVAHSRGGLVARVLAERGTEVGLDSKITVRTLIMVGTPNAGTALADREHLGSLLDRVTNLVQLIPDNPVSDTIEIVITVLKQLAVGALGGLAGLMSMAPRGDYLVSYLNKPASTNATYRAVASNFEPLAGSSLLRIARDSAIDIVFGSTHNDLIVPTDGVYRVPGLDGFAPTERLVFPAETGVDHSSYWNQPVFADRLLTWLSAAN